MYRFHGSGFLKVWTVPASVEEDWEAGMPGIVVVPRGLLR